MKELVGIYGASGFGREVLPTIRSCMDTSLVDIVFIDDASDTNQNYGTYDILSWDDFLARPAKRRSVSIAIANSAVRQALTERCQQAGVSLLTVSADNVVMGDNVNLGEGAILQPFVMLTADVQIGASFHANIYSYVAHDCVIGDFVTFAPSVKCNGNVRIEDHAYIGTGAILKQGTPEKPLIIGAGAVIGMGAVVTKDVPPGATVVGNPAKPLLKG
ncbi:MAG: acetyltransferase [Sphingobium sp.]|nr:MAG: acetyltransferase [Sphingobium sp.]